MRKKGMREERPKPSSTSFYRVRRDRGILSDRKRKKQQNDCSGNLPKTIRTRTHEQVERKRGKKLQRLLQGRKAD